VVAAPGAGEAPAAGEGAFGYPAQLLAFTALFAALVTVGGLGRRQRPSEAGAGAGAGAGPESSNPGFRFRFRVRKGGGSGPGDGGGPAVRPDAGHPDAPAGPEGGVR
ncbi:hypothetical protein, partial [Streptomyces clavuligerus]|uniref:hypothetical protein n=1 Tax=Streptomyces clavuligerus TaxID=1901 RepID=UPI0018D0DD42